ncbi:MAG: hypothetical protein B7Z72_02775 [Gemmatimonadetes bacterium 21-71-4]|nr:MAG: hypothetical protein B7Z72_02775 [Gemmatimonadetes bacterium 21-71-4]
MHVCVVCHAWSKRTSRRRGAGQTDSFQVTPTFSAPREVESWQLAQAYVWAFAWWHAAHCAGVGTGPVTGTGAWQEVHATLACIVCPGTDAWQR